MVGMTVLWNGCNPLTAALGLLNAFLYAGSVYLFHFFCSVFLSSLKLVLVFQIYNKLQLLPLHGVFIGVYTPMKRYSIGCTWVGAIVGAVPPLIGYAGATGSIQPASLVLAALLYCWQFPHFNALSWNLRSDYTRAGYRVMCAVNQRLCRLTSLR